MVNLLSRFSSHASELCGSFWRKVIMILSHIYRGIERCNVGKGDTVLFWKDLWEDQVMTDQCPHLHSFSIKMIFQSQIFVMLLTSPSPSVWRSKSRMAIRTGFNRWSSRSKWYCRWMAIYMEQVVLLKAVLQILFQDQRATCTFSMDLENESMA
jgi:hypothetical protein